MRKLAKETDPEKIGLLNEELGILKAQLKEITDQKFQQGLEAIGFGFATIAVSAQAIIRMLPQIMAAVKFFGALGSLAIPAGSVFAGLLNPLTAIGVAMALLGRYIADFLVNLFGLDEWRKNNGRLLEEYFLRTIPNALTATGLWFWNIFTVTIPAAFQTMFTNLVNGFTILWQRINELVLAGLNLVRDHLKKFADFFIGLWNNMLNAIRGLGGFGKTAPTNFSGMQGSAVINSLHAATGFEGMITQPTLMTVGENGSEYVSVTPHGKSPNGGSPTIIVNVHGSVISERQLFSIVDGYLKDSYKRRGFTGV